MQCHTFSLLPGSFQVYIHPSATTLKPLTREVNNINHYNVRLLWENSGLGIHADAALNIPHTPPIAIVLLRNSSPPQRDKSSKTARAQ